MIKPEETIPKQYEGKEINVEESVELSSEKEAIDFFSVVKERLQKINQWKDWAGTLSAGFTLTNERGEEVNSLPKESDYFKIDIPAPGIISGEGYDWVRVEEVKEESNSECDYISIRVRPSSSPVNENKDVAHFLGNEATSNFIVRRDGNKITAGVYGRNEKPNVQAETLIDKVRNAVVGTGAFSGFAKLQWNGLVSGLLKKE